MKFFMPGVPDENLERSHNALREHAVGAIGHKPSANHIFALDYIHDGNSDRAEVGQIDRGSGEVVVAILEASNTFLICTPHYGVLGGEGMMVGKDEVSSITYFDE